MSEKNARKVANVATAFAFHAGFFGIFDGFSFFLHVSLYVVNSAVALFPLSAHFSSNLSTASSMLS